MEAATTPDVPSLHPAQVCFVVDDVARSVQECETRFGWGPFHVFSAPVSEARYGDWRGPKHTEVALGMAGGVQVELIHVHEGRDTVAAYQARYGTGFQHLGISCRDRERALVALEALGARVDDRGEYPGIRFAFVDVPTGPGMFELLQATGDGPPGGGGDPSEPAAFPAHAIDLDRASIVTRELDASLAFYARAFRWDQVVVEERTLRHGDRATKLRRARGRAGRLLLELVEGSAQGLDPYSQHAARGDHGLVHAGGVPRQGTRPDAAALECEWEEDGEAFGLYDWAGGPRTLQVRER